MIVSYKNALYQLDADSEFFQNFKKNCPDIEVIILTLTASTYKEVLNAPLRDLEEVLVPQKVVCSRN